MAEGDVNAVLAKYPVIVRQAVAWGDMDSYKHVNNVVYFRYFENARLAYFRAMGWHEYEAQTGIGPILSATSARFRRPLEYPDNIAIGARVSDIGEDRCAFEYVIVSEAQQAVVTEGTGLIVIYHYGEGKKVKMPAELRQRIEALEARCGGAGA